ncbi:hypothetical protein K439DRAFT_410851 [Ramaria rubella]|nr:hypothetical protein K439DRAFT_410851 [Ramaria rubella]
MGRSHRVGFVEGRSGGRGAAAGVFGVVNGVGGGGGGPYSGTGTTIGTSTRPKLGAYSYSCRCAEIHTLTRAPVHFLLLLGACGVRLVGLDVAATACGRGRHYVCRSYCTRFRIDTPLHICIPTRPHTTKHKKPTPPEPTTELTPPPPPCTPSAHTHDTPPRRIHPCAQDRLLAF